LACPEAVRLPEAYGSVASLDLGDGILVDEFLDVGI
jgi:hypothetical protein